MSTTVYSLLVGIDEYRAPIPALRGCVRDIRSIETALRERTLKPGVEYKPRVLLNEEATRRAVISGFLDHLALAGPSDVALFYYAGHGSQERTPPEFWHLEPDRLDETLVCIDSREPGNYDLADKELAKLLAQVARQGAHVLVILDSCHSGSGTRESSTRGVRRVPTDLRQRNADTFLVTPAEAAALQNRALSPADDSVPPQKGRHVLLAACRDNEEAREVLIDGQTRGAFSHILLGAIEQATSAPTYRDLMKRVNALVRLQVSGQYPLVEATHREDLNRPFLGGNLVEQRPYFSVTFDRADGWVMDGGALHGIPQPAGSETTHLALFEQNAKDLSQLPQSVGEAQITVTLPTRSKLQLKLTDESRPHETAMFKGVITALPLPAMSFALTGDAAGVDQIRAALNASSGRPLLIRESDQSAELAVRCTENAVRICRADDPRPLCADISGYGPTAARTAVARLEHIARWRRIATLTNPAARLRPDAVQIHVYRLGPQGGAQGTNYDPETNPCQLRFDYQFVNGEWSPARFKIKLVNTANQRLFCTLLAMSQAFGISAELLPSGGLWLDPSQEAWAFDGQPIAAWVPDALWSSGLAEINDLLKLIVSTEESDATLLEQDDLDAPYLGSTTRGLGSANTLERLFGRVQTRALGAGPGSIGKVADWRTTEVAVLTYRPLNAVQLSATASTSVAPNVRVHPHSKLRAVARLVSLPTATRSASMAPLPPALVDDPSRVQPLELSNDRGAYESLSVLELEVDDPVAYQTVSTSEPLVLTIQTELKDGEHVLPVGFDGEFYLPLGRARKTPGGLEVRLERLPKAVSTRSITSAIRILFEKIVSDTLGKEFRYPLLTAVERSGKRTDDQDVISRRVSQSKRILLYVHGIIGDTLGMAASAFETIEADDKHSSIADRYDVVLAFDYENLKTPIEETARDLKQRLEAVGLKAGHGKELHVVAHSMGGLVSRWFVEREGGNSVVQQLVMLGTPNAGSPWSTIEDWATAALALGLNGLTVAAWPAKILGSLVAAIEYVDVALDQMKPDSQLLRTLSASPDPGIPYTILAGNTSIIATDTEPQSQRSHLVSRLLDRVSPQRVLHKMTGLAFFGQPNDIAVSVVSIVSLPPGRKELANVREVTSDHISYFTTPAVLAELNRQLL